VGTGGLGGAGGTGGSAGTVGTGGVAGTGGAGGLAGTGGAGGLAGTGGTGGTCAQQCPQWGVSCANGVLETCVYDLLGCRVRLAKTCSLGCNASGDACASCGALPQPFLDREPQTAVASYQDLVVSGDTVIAAYRGRNANGPLTTAGLAPFNVADPHAIAPLPLQQLYADGYLRNIRLDGNRLYALGASALGVFDASDPRTPAALGSFTPSGTPADVSVDGNTACVVASDGLHVIDVSNGAAPAQVGFLALTNAPDQVVCKGRYAALASSSNSQLRIGDLQDRTAPVLVATTGTSAMTYPGAGRHSLQFDGNTAYLISYYSITGNNQLQYQLDSYQWSPPSTLTRAGSATPAVNMFGTTLRGTDIGFFTNDSIGIIDASVPGAPRIKKQTVTNEYPSGIVLSGGAAYFGTTALSSFDMSLVPDRVVRTGRGKMCGAAVQGGIAYIAHCDNGITVEDIRDPLAPVQLARIDGVRARGVAVQGRYLYATVVDTNAVNWLQIYDVSTPWLPVAMGTAPGQSRFMAGTLDHPIVQGNLLYALCDIGYICVYDVSNAAAPSRLVVSSAIVDVGGGASAGSVFTMSGTTMYTPGKGGLGVVDMSNLAATVVVKTVPLTPAPYGQAQVAVDGHYAYLTSRCNQSTVNHCTYVLDITDPLNPVPMGVAIDDIKIFANLYPLQTPLDDYSLRVRDGFLYVSNSWGGLYVLDVTNPAQPKRVNEYWTPSPTDRSYQFDRYVVAHLPNDSEQVIEMCH
jgi:hypothetical protein